MPSRTARFIHRFARSAARALLLACCSLLACCGESAPTPPVNANQSFDPDLALKELSQMEDDFAQAKQIKRLEPMVEKCKAFIDKYPKYPPAYTMLAKVYIEQYHWPDAYEQLQKSLKLESNQPMVHHLAGTILYEMRDFPLAESHYLTAQQLDPNDPLHPVYLAQVYIRTNKHVEARMRLLNALQLDSQFHQAYATMSDLFMAENEPQLALQQIDKAIKFTTLDNRQVMVNYVLKRANIYRRLGDAAAAMAVLTDDLLEHEQFDANVAEDIAITWGMMNEFAKAAESYERAIAADPTEWRLYKGAVEWHLKAGNVFKAKNYLRGLRAIEPHQPAIKALEDSIARAEAKQAAAP